LRAQAEALADGGVYRAIATLHDPRPEVRWRTDGTEYEFALGEGIVRVRIEDEAGKIDLNAAPADLMQALLRVVGVDELMAATLVQSIFAFDASSDPSLSDEDDADSGRQRFLFDDVEQLRELPGMNAAILERVAPFVTVYTRQSGVDPSVAPREVLLALGTDPSTIEDLLAARGGDDPREWPDALSGLISQSQRRVFAIIASATVGGAVFIRRAVIRLTYNPELPFLVHSWRHLPSASVAIAGTRQ
jgi:general secretion pathway protein K